MAHFKKSVDWEKEREHKVAFTIFFVQFDLVSWFLSRLSNNVI